MTCGVYVITCTANGKQYVGSSRGIERRWRVHRWSLNRNSHYNPHLQRSWNKYGSNAFVFALVEAVPLNALITREMFWIEQFKPEYNLAIPNLELNGWTASPETLVKLSAIQKGIPKSPETRAKLSAAIKGVKRGPLSDSTRRKISEVKKGHIAWNKGLKQSDTMRAKTAASWTNKRRRELSERMRCQPSWNKGRAPWNKGLRSPKLTTYEQIGVAALIAGLEQYRAEAEVYTRSMLDMTGVTKPAKPKKRSNQ